MAHREGLDAVGGFLGYELNLSCPNDTRLGGLPSALDPDALHEVVTGVRELTERPMLVKLAPNVPDIGPVAEAAEAAGADGITLVNTMPGLIIDVDTGAAALGRGRAVSRARLFARWGSTRCTVPGQCTSVPLVGVGGITDVNDALQYLLAGASLVQIGTATFADPRAAERVVRGLAHYGEGAGVDNIRDLVGAFGRKESPVGASGGEH